jgi:hypothetical protein
MTKLIIPIYLVLCGCSHSETKQQEQVQQSNVDVEKDENFDKFFKKFNIDTVFQKTRLHKPVLLQVIDEESNTESYTTSKLNTVKVSFTKKGWKEKVSFFFRKVSKDTVIVEIKGIDTGLMIEHYFVKEKSLWYLDKIRDLSD